MGQVLLGCSQDVRLSRRIKPFINKTKPSAFQTRATKMKFTVFVLALVSASNAAECTLEQLQEIETCTAKVSTTCDSAASSDLAEVALCACDAVKEVEKCYTDCDFPVDEAAKAKEICGNVGSLPDIPIGSGCSVEKLAEVATCLKAISSDCTSEGTDPATTAQCACNAARELEKCKSDCDFPVDEAASSEVICKDYDSSGRAPVSVGCATMAVVGAVLFFQ